MNIKLDVQNIVFAYNSKPVLNDICFQVESGRLVSLVGPNGSGKSTLLKCIDNIISPRRGKILVDENEIKRLSRIRTAKVLTYVPQNIQRVFPHSVHDVVFMGRRPHLGWIGQQKDKEKVWEVLDLLGLVDMAMKAFTELSGGQQQKVLIARALAQETGLILLDEPTSNLDIWHQLDVLNVVRQLVTDKQVTVIMALHDLNLASRFSDDILMMRAGRITAVGTPEDVLTQINIAEVYDVEATVAFQGNTPYVVPLRQL